MPPTERETRLTALEREVARLRAKVEGGAPSSGPWWEVVAGSFADDPAHDWAMGLGREYRASLRPEPSRRKKR